MKAQICVLIFYLTFFWIPNTYADDFEKTEGKVKLYQAPVSVSEKTRPNRISIELVTPSIYIKKAANEYWVQVKGENKTQEDAIILEDGFRVISSKVGSFEFQVQISQNRTRLNILQINLFGQVQKSEYFLETSFFTPKEKEAPPEPSPSPSESPRSGTAWSVGLGLTSVTYKETKSKDYSANWLTLKGSASRRLSSWRLYGNLYISALPISSDALGRSLRFIGFNLRAGRTLIEQRRFKISLFAGIYYTTTMASGENFGFAGLMGPQLYPLFEYILTSRQSFYLYAKYSPIFQNLKPSFTSHETAAGGGYQTYVFQRPVSFGLDYSQLSLVFPHSILIDSQSLSLSAALLF